MSKILTFGEIMMRLQPYGYKRLLQANGLEMTFGGGEANVAVSLAQMGDDAAFLTKLPNNELGKASSNQLRYWGVNTDYIVRGGERMGIYFCEKGASQRASKVIYDRKNSAINSINEDEVDFDNLLKTTEWLHFTGITPALSDEVANFTKLLLIKAKEKNITVSCDLNYRNKLWTREKANIVMSNLMQYVDVLISNEEDCKDVFGIVAGKSDITSGELSKEDYGDVAKTLAKKFGIKIVAFTLRESISASINNWSGILVDSGKVYSSKKYTLNIVDRVGGGDSFGAGLIHSLTNGKNPQEAIEFAIAASALKHSVEGDFNIATVEEIEKLANGDGSGRVQR